MVVESLVLLIINLIRVAVPIGFIAFLVSALVNANRKSCEQALAREKKLEKEQQNRYKEIMDSLKREQYNYPISVTGDYYEMGDYCSYLSDTIADVYFCKYMSSANNCPYCARRYVYESRGSEEPVYIYGPSESNCYKKYYLPND